MKNKVLGILCIVLPFTLSAFADNIKDIASLKKEYLRPKVNTPPYPTDNLYNKDRENLGKMLFFDPRISSSKITSCATCHNPSFSWGDGLPKGVGVNHQVLGRRTPTLLNLAWADRFFWDGRAHSLEEQSLGPIQAEKEMNLTLVKMVAVLKAIDGYKPLFQKAFPKEADPINDINVGKAIAAYERTIVSGIAPFDRWIAGDEKAVSESAKNGFKIYNTKARCQSCHSGWSFTDHSFHDIGHSGKDEGRFKILKLPSMAFAFKTPTLRNVANRAPFMHDGSLPSLEAVVDFYNRGGDIKRSSVDSNIEVLNLTEQEKKDLVTFMKTLSSIDAPVTLPILPTN